MAILNYTTTIAPEKSIMEIQKVLSEYGASSIMIDYKEGKPTSITFMIFMNNYPVNFRLPSNYKGVLKVMSSDPKIPSKYKRNDQALRVSWRIIKDWLKAQLALIESGQAELSEILLPYVVNDSGRTLSEVFNENKEKFLNQ